MDLRLSADLAIARRADLRELIGLPWFSAMAVTEGNRLLFEAYAPEFGPDRPHSIMSVSKMSVNLILGRLWEEGRVDLAAPVGHILSEIGAGYAGAMVQDVLNMNVLNPYEEDYHNPDTTAFLHEPAMGMRLPAGAEPTNRAFLNGIGLSPGRADTTNPTGLCLYKSANTDVLACVAEVAGGRPLALWLADLADAAGVEGALHVGTDRSGFPALNGGISPPPATCAATARFSPAWARGAAMC